MMFLGNKIVDFFTRVARVLEISSPALAVDYRYISIVNWATHIKRPHRRRRLITWSCVSADATRWRPTSLTDYFREAELGRQTVAVNSLSASTHIKHALLYQTPHSVKLLHLLLRRPLYY